MLLLELVRFVIVVFFQYLLLAGVFLVPVQLAVLSPALLGGAGLSLAPDLADDGGAALVAAVDPVELVG